MIRFRLKELIADYEFREQRRLTLEEISRVTGIHRTTLSKIARRQGYNTTTDYLDRLCEFFNCKVEMLIEHVLIAPTKPAQISPSTVKKKR